MCPIIVADKRLILNYMKVKWSIPLAKILGEDNMKAAISLFKEQNLTKEEKLILDKFQEK
jgi:hypothetical protein